MIIFLSCAVEINCSYVHLMFVLLTILKKKSQNFSEFRFEIVESLWRVFKLSPSQWKRIGERVRGAQLSRGRRLPGAPPSLTPRLRQPATTLRPPDRNCRLHTSVGRQTSSAAYVCTDTVRKPTAMWWSETVKRDTLSHTGNLSVHVNINFKSSPLVICEFEVVPLFWKIGLYERIMALARWAILVVGVNTELVYFIMFIEGLADGWVVIWFRTREVETGTELVYGQTFPLRCGCDPAVPFV